MEKRLGDVDKLLKDLRHPTMPPLEQELKKCLALRPDLQGKVLSGAEMADYMLWMLDNFGDKAGSVFSDSDMPPMLFGGGISEIGQNVFRHPKDSAARESLVSLYGMPLESGFFREGQDISAGRELRYCPPYWRSDDYFELFYVFSGNCPVMFEGETVTLTPGNILIVPPGVRKAYTFQQDDCAVLFCMLRRSTFSQVFWASLESQDLMGLFFRQALSGENSTPYLRFDTGQDERLERILCYIYLEYELEGKYVSKLLNSLMSTYFLLLLQEYEDTAQVSQRNGLRWKREYAEILNYVGEHFATVTLEELSQTFNYSQRQLIRIIRAGTGKNLTELISRLRMEKAARLIKAGTASLEEISNDVGFANLSGFYRAFTKYYGCTPKKYAASERKSGQLPKE